MTERIGDKGAYESILCFREEHDRCKADWCTCTCHTKETPMVTSQTQCPRCTGKDGAHFAFCFLAQAWERFMGPAYPWRANIEDAAAAEMLRIVQESERAQQADLAYAEGARHQAALRDAMAPLTESYRPQYTTDEPEAVPLDTGDWFEEWRRGNTIAVGEDDFTFLSDLHADYLAWCKERGYPAMGDVPFGRRMMRCGYRRGRPVDHRTGAQLTAYYGVALKRSLLEAPAPEQAPEPEQPIAATVAPEPEAAPAPAPAPAPEPDPIEQRKREATWVRTTLAANGKTQQMMATDLGRKSGADVSNALNGVRLQPELWNQILNYTKGLPEQVPGAPGAPLRVVETEKPPAPQGRVPAEEQDRILAWLSDHTEAAPDDHWTSISRLTEEFMKTHSDLHPIVASRYVGFVITSLGYRKDRAAKGPVPGHPASGEPAEIPRGRAVYYGIRVKGSSEPAAPAEEETPDWMQNPESTERKVRISHDGDVPGREIPKEYRDKIVMPLIEQGWTYRRNNSNGSGKPRITNPQGHTYALASTPSDVKGLRNAISHLRKLGAQL